MIRITAEQAHAMRQNLQAIAGHKDLPTSLIWDVAKKMAVIGVRAAVVDRTKILTYLKHGVRNEQTGDVSLTPEQRAAADYELEPLLAENVEVPGDPLPLSELLKLSGVTALDLAPLVEIIIDDRQ